MAELGECVFVLEPFIKVLHKGDLPSVSRGTLEGVDVGLYCVRAVRAVRGDLFPVVSIQDLPGWKKAIGEFGDKSVEGIADVF